MCKICSEVFFAKICLNVNSWDEVLRLNLPFKDTVRILKPFSCTYEAIGILPKFEFEKLSIFL